MFGGPSPAALGSRFTAIAHKLVVDGPTERAERAKRRLLAAVADHEPATLNDVAAAVERGAPAVSRSVDALVRAGLIERAPDRNNRRRLAMRLTQAGREALAHAPAEGGAITARFERFAPSELRAIERALEILERST